MKVHLNIEYTCPKYDSCHFQNPFLQTSSIALTNLAIQKSQNPAETHPLQLRLPQHPILLRHKRRNRIHETRTQCIIRLQPQCPQLPPNLLRLLRSNKSLLNNTTHKARKLNFLPSLLATQLHMHKVQTLEGMILFNSSKEMNATVAASVSLNHRFLINDVEVFCTARDG